MRRAVVLGLLFLGACASTDEAGEERVFELRFDFSDSAAFALSDQDGGSLELLGAADYQPPHRSPRAIALLDGWELRSFELECELLQTGREYGHRDLCLFFGFQAPDRFYYVHLATTPDENAHNVFLVDGAPRRNLLPPQAAGIDWGQDEWHHVKLARDVDDGSIRVWFDRAPEPVLEATDATLAWGRVGFGSFDDTGVLRDLVIRSSEVREVTVEGSPFGH